MGGEVGVATISTILANSGYQFVLNLMPSGSLEKLSRFLTEPPQHKELESPWPKRSQTIYPKDPMGHCSVTEAEQTEKLSGESKGRLHVPLFASLFCILGFRLRFHWLKKLL